MKTKFITLIILAFIGLSSLHAQVGIGTKTPDPSSVLDLTATDKGFLPPRLTTAERDAISSPAEGLTIYNTEENCLEFWNGTFWISACDRTVSSSGPCNDALAEIQFNGLTYKPVEAVGNCWLDRNLGATQVATASNDAASYGDLYQWGRAADGHQVRTSGTTTNTLATTAVPDQGNPWDGLFSIVNISPFDWLATQDNTLWQGVTGTNNPCPAGYRVPTETELVDLDGSFTTQDAAGAFGSPLKMPLAGLRDDSDAVLKDVGFRGVYWSSTVSGVDASTLSFDSGGSSILFANRANGLSVRCLKD